MISKPEEFEGPRLCQPEERAASRRLSRRCFGDFGEEEPDVVNNEAEMVSAPGEAYVMTHQGRLVSQIHIFHHTIQIPGGVIRLGSIGGVCTDPDYRGLGLASQVLDHCTNQLKQGGANLMLISGGRGLYTRVGCVPAGKFITFEFTPGMHVPYEVNVQLQPATSSDSDIFHQLYLSEAVHFERNRDQFLAHLQRPGMYINAYQWKIEAAGRAQAYLFLGIPWEEMGYPEGGRAVMEYAGSRTALATAIPEILSQPGLRKLLWSVPWQDHELINLFTGMGCRGKPAPLFDHTMRIINFPGLMSDLQAYQETQVNGGHQEGLRFDQTGPLLSDQGDDRYSITRGRDCLDLNGAEMTGLVMGGISEADFADQIASSGLQDVISALFPLPSFFPGIDYH